MAEGLPCSIAGCEYTTTTQVPDDTEFALKVQLLQIHSASAHTGSWDQFMTEVSDEALVELQTHTDPVHVFPPVSRSQPEYVSRPISLSWVKELAYNERFWNTEEVVYVCDKDTARNSPATYSGYDASLVNTNRMATERRGP